jgi:hypothetical protein
MFVDYLLDQFRFSIGHVAVDHSGRSRVADERKHVSQLEVGQQAAAIP